MNFDQCTKLTFLDNRPVKDIDRACIQAWAKVKYFGVIPYTAHGAQIL